MVAVRPGMAPTKRPKHAARKMVISVSALKTRPTARANASMGRLPQNSTRQRNAEAGHEDKIDDACRDRAEDDCRQPASAAHEDDSDCKEGAGNEEAQMR